MGVFKPNRPSSRLKKSGTLLAAAIALVGTWEGLRTVAYPDRLAHNIPTVCYGWTIGVELGDKYTVEECKVMLGDGLIEFEQGIRTCLRNPDTLPGKVYVSLISLAYNIGKGAFCRSSIARKANAGDLRGACNAITLYNRAGGRVVKGLVNRRADEKRLCLEGLAS